MTLKLQHITNIYFLGIGGIGMSALARYFYHIGKNVAGYDLTETTLTKKLVSEGIAIHYNENIKTIPDSFKKDNTIVVYTPAVPDSHLELSWFKQNDFLIYKRAKVLGILCNESKCIAVAGTHGKTTVSTMVSVILKESGVGCGAFLGGISSNYQTNLILPENDNNWLVTEADEYDRSFLNLKPSIALITAIDSDHLDIYKNIENLRKSFFDFTRQVKKWGRLIVKAGINFPELKSGDFTIQTYSLNEKADYYAENIQANGNGYRFDLIGPGNVIKNLQLNNSGLINVDNAVGAIALALSAGVSVDEVKSALALYKGVKRRFDIRFNNKQVLFIDDYAHHPKELEAAIMSVKKLYPGKKVTGIFQPHLFSRTQDFAGEFAQSLDLLDKAVVLPIYPAREKPIEGVTSHIIIQKMKNTDSIFLEIEEVENWLGKNDFEIIMTLGAGNIDKLADNIVGLLKRRYDV
jgi:UDP-N-acetylmuramate--alanine ligase